VTTTFQKFAAIIVTADHGCSSCARSLVKQCEEAFPEQDWQQLVREADPNMGADLFDPPPVRTGPPITLKDMAPALEEYGKKLAKTFEGPNALLRFFDGK
jgi:hypothetical protein